jgi:tetratricopeptide (TPR) repeat protein
MRREYHQARELSNRILARLSDMKGTRLPGERELVAGVLDDTLAFYGGTLENSDDPDPQVRADTAEALYQVGLMHGYLGQGPSAIADFTRAARLFEGLAAEHPEEFDYRAGQSKCYHSLGCLTAGEESLNWCRRALALREELYHLAPENTNRAADLAQGHHQLAATLQSQTRSREAEEHYAKCIALLKKVLEQIPGGANYQAALAESYCNLGLIYHHTDRREKEFAQRRGQADRLFQDAESLLEPLTRNYPQHFEFHASLASVWLNWANLLYESGHPGAALATYQRGIDLMEDVLRREPRFQQARVDVINLHGGKATAYEGNRSQAA